MEHNLLSNSTEKLTSGIAIDQDYKNDQWSSIWMNKPQNSNKTDMALKEKNRTEGINFKRFDLQRDIVTGLLHVIAKGHHTLAIFNSSGYLMNHYIFANKMEVDTSDYPKGIYTVQLDRATQRLILD